MCRSAPPNLYDNTMKLHMQTFAISSLFAALTMLSACDKDGSTLGQKVDNAVASTERAASAAKAEIKEVASDAKVSASGASGTISTSTRDGVITTKVNAELVKDTDLSAMKINVDTADGHVILNGSAPSQIARDRASSLARGVDGVKDVDNRLAIEVKR